MNIKPLGAALGIFLLTATIILPLPQLLKLHHRRSSAGVQPSTLCLVFMYSATNAASTAAMKWRQLELCSALGGYCLIEQLDTMQVFVSSFSWMVILIYVVHLPPCNTPKWRRLAAATFSGVAALWGVTCIVSAREPCGPAAVGLARALGWASAVLVVIAFAPQLRETWRSKRAGSLSLVFIFIQAVGCFIVSANQLFDAHDSWPIWLPTTVSGCMQLAIFAIAAFYQCCAATDPCSADPFLASVGPESLGSPLAPAERMQ